jgi:hypothetical protein
MARDENTGEPHQPEEEDTILANARSLDSFRAWRDHLPSFELDGERLYLPTGDVPADEHELAVEWFQRHDEDE